MILPSTRLLAPLGLLLVAAVATGAVAAGITAADRARIADAARLAQERCYRLIHHDTFAFGQCVGQLAQAESKGSAARLGVEYFGWVGAVNSARLGMLGAEATAQDFLTRFRRTQAVLRIDDQTLCGTIPGDCVARVARLKAMEQDMRAGHIVPQSSAADQADGHDHAH